jgi:hypothetical protein
MKRLVVQWLKEPKDTNYPAALSYLSLIFDPEMAGKYVKRLKRAKVCTFKSKDIFRASGLSLLGISNFFVEKDLRKIRKGMKLSPILLVRDPVHGKVIVADGYHRMCAVYSVDEEAPIPCKIA